MGRKARLCGIIPLYHSKQQLLSRLLAAISPDSVVLVANDGRDYSDYREAKLLKPTCNLGFGGGANSGMVKVFNQNFDWAVILNQDLEMTPAAWKELAQILSQKSPGIYGPFIGSLDRKRFTTVFPSLDPDPRCTYVSGACLAIHRTVYQNIGGFYEPYFMYYEDADLCLLAKKQGFPVEKVHLSGLKHIQLPVFPPGSADHEYYLARNHFRFVWRQAPQSLILREMIRLPYSFRQQISKGNKAAVTGLIHGLISRQGEWGGGIW
jgi:GT2 family glycosyltransferase